MICPHCRANNVESARFCEACGKPVSAVPRASEAGSEGLSAMQTIDPGQAPPPPAGGRSPLQLQTGQMFSGRYRIDGELGRGGMGVVYRAHDTVTDRDVALKVIRGDRLAGRDAVKRLIREGVLARDIRHPNVVAVYDVGEVEGLPFLSMELLDGASLRAWTQKRMREGADCPMATAANVVREILAGLGAAHAQGIIHRDLKPENVVLLGEPSEAGAKLKILDFGIARAAGGTETGATSLGTMEYMSPEQMTAPEAVTASADFYSLSVMFYELLVGVVPKGHWQPPSAGRSDVPPAIDRLIERGLSNNPRQRPQTAEAYRAELEAALAPQPAPQPVAPPPVKPQPSPSPAPAPPAPDADGARPAPAPGAWRTSPWLSPKRLGIMGAAAAAVVVVGVAVSGMMSQPPTPTYSSASLPGASDPPPADPPSFSPPPADPQPLQPSQAQSGNPPPDTSNYAALSGGWLDSGGNYISVRVDADGAAEGTVLQGPLSGAGMEAEFYGVGIDMAFYHPSYGAVAAARGQLADACHIQYNSFDAAGAVIGQGVIHINHQPNEPCPPTGR